MDWTVWGSNPGGGDICCICPDWPSAPPTSYIVGSRSFPGVKWPECGIDRHPHLVPSLKQGIELCLYCTAVPSRHGVG